MKVFSLLVSFCLFQALICATLEVNEQTLKNAASKSLPFVKVFHQDTLNIENKGLLHGITLKYPVLTVGNMQFKFDEFGLLHIKYLNLRLQISGKNRAQLGHFNFESKFDAELNNFNWEQIFAIKLNDKGNGKVEINYTKTSESDVNFNISKFNTKVQSKYNIRDLDNSVKNQIRQLNFNPLKEQLRKITQLIFDTLQNEFNQYIVINNK